MTTQKNIPTWLIFGFIILGFIGFLDASYLTVNHFTGADLECSILDGCNEVTTSEYSEVFGIPVALGGVIYYLIIMLSALIYQDSKKAKFLRFLPLVTAVGLLCSAWFLYAQAVLIEAYCQYCIVSIINSAILFVLGMILWRKHLR